MMGEMWSAGREARVLEFTSLSISTHAGRLSCACDLSGQHDRLVEQSQLRRYLLGLYLLDILADQNELQPSWCYSRLVIG